MFSEIKNVVENKIKQLSKNTNLFVVDLDSNELFDAYLNCFDDPLERQIHNCNCCKYFLRNYGGIIAINENYEYETIWDFEISGLFEKVPKVLSKIVKTKVIKHCFHSDSNQIGTSYNYKRLEDNDVIKFEHFSGVVDNKFVYSNSHSYNELIGKDFQDYDLLYRSLEIITKESLDIVIDLIDQNSIYKGAEFLKILKDFRKLKIEFDITKNKYIFCWANCKTTYGLKNTVIGTLLVDLSNGVELDNAVRMYESKVAPQNYKRPKALITQKMIENAEKEIKNLGLEASLYRRYANKDDIPIEQVFFVNKAIKQRKGIFDEMKNDSLARNQDFSKIEEIGIRDFINKVLPNSKKVEVFLDHKHKGNLMSLIAPQSNESKHIFKWNNNMSWSYINDFSDSVKEKVKKAGGKVDGELRISLEWFNTDDLDIHVIEPNGNSIYFGKKSNINSNGTLDVDMNFSTLVTDPVENIIFKEKSKMLEGAYKVLVNNFNKRNNNNFGFNVEIEHNNDVIVLTYDKKVLHKETICVCEFQYDKVNGLTIEKSIKKDLKSSLSYPMWNLNSNKFYDVSVIANSPNFWGDNKIGNEHVFFIIDGAINDDPPRGMFNEFLLPELDKHRKVFEVLGSKLKVEHSNDQLSGLGFSLTQRNSLICKVSGSSTRTLKVNF